MIGERGQMGILNRGQYTDVAENLLQFDQVNTGLQKVGCIAVSERVA